MNRRRVLLGLTAGIPFLAGCSTYVDIGGNDTTTRSPTATTVATTARTTAARSTVPTDTATANGWSSATATVGAATPNFSARETYTNNRYAYTIEYPTGWTIDATDPSSVTIESSVGALFVELMEDIPSSLTTEDITPVFVGDYKDSIKEKGGSVEELGRQNVTLPNDHAGTMISLRMEQATNVFQQKMLITVTNDSAYAAVIMVLDAVSTADIEKRLEAILLTLTISESNVQTESSGVRV